MRKYIIADDIGQGILNGDGGSWTEENPYERTVFQALIGFNLSEINGS